MTQRAEIERLVERLRRKELYRPNEWQLANPDGPEAADALTALIKREGELMEALTNLVNAVGPTPTISVERAVGIASAALNPKTESE